MCIVREGIEGHGGGDEWDVVSHQFQTSSFAFLTFDMSVKRLKFAASTKTDSWISHSWISKSSTSQPLASAVSMSDSSSYEGDTMRKIKDF